MAVPIVVCACGARLRAPGARPGRVGRCPGCGASLRMPGPAAGAVEAEPERAAAPPKKRRTRAAAKGESLIASHRYPFRGPNGVAYLAFLPLAWWAVSLGPFLLLASILVGDRLADLARVAFVPSLLGIAPALAFTLAYLGRAFVATVAGDDQPPRWPEPDVWEALGALATWAVALASGAVVGAVPAWLLWKHTEGPGNLDRAAIAGLLAFGAVYAQVSLAAGLLFGDLLAMNPWTVLKGVWTIGRGLIRPLAYACVASAAAAALLRPLLHSTEPIVSLPGWLVFWAFSLYAALVSTRVWGVECRRRARSLGWFREGDDLRR